MRKKTAPSVSWTIENGIAVIKMDDGNQNLISPEMIYQLNKALDRAEKAGAVVVLTGRDGVFSAGFDLGILKTGLFNTFNMLIGGFKLSRRLLGFPMPVVIASTGHAVAMGAFLLLSGDYRIGVKGAFKIVANEVEIGLTIPFSAVEICRQRLRPGHFDRAVLLSERYDPVTAVTAGFLDKVVTKRDLMSEARRQAELYMQLDEKAHKESKLRTRRALLLGLDLAILADRADFLRKGVKRVIGR